MEEFLNVVRDRLGHSPRQLGLLSRWRLRRRPPRWMSKDDALMEVFRQQDTLLSEGEVFWGALVQANRLLFQAGPDDHPALTIYALDKSFDSCPERLQAIARQLHTLKNTTPEDPQERKLAEMITDEMERGLGYKIPKTFTAGKEVRSTALMVFRAHIPGGILRSGWFPLLAHPAAPAVLIVPHKFWPPELIRAWSGT